MHPFAIDTFSSLQCSIAHNGDGFINAIKGLKHLSLSGHTNWLWTLARFWKGQPLHTEADRFSLRVYNVAPRGKMTPNAVVIIQPWYCTSK